MNRRLLIEVSLLAPLVFLVAKISVGPETVFQLMPIGLVTRVVAFLALCALRPWVEGTNKRIVDVGLAAQLAAICIVGVAWLMPAQTDLQFDWLELTRVIEVLAFLGLGARRLSSGDWRRFSIPRPVKFVGVAAAMALCVSLLAAIVTLLTGSPALWVLVSPLLWLIHGVGAAFAMVPSDLLFALGVAWATSDLRVSSERSVVWGPLLSGVVSGGLAAGVLVGAGFVFMLSQTTCDGGLCGLPLGIALSVAPHVGIVVGLIVAIVVPMVRGRDAKTT